MRQYIGTKMIKAEPMTRQQYNDFRGWTLPVNENGADDGYLVEYLDGGAPNVATSAGFVSWSPKQQFEAAYIALPLGADKLMPHQQRVVAEKAQLDVKIYALHSFMRNSNAFESLTQFERNHLQIQFEVMNNYSEILALRISHVTPLKTIQKQGATPI